AGHRHGRPRQEFLHRHHLAAGDTGLVGDDAFDVLDAACLEPVACLVEGFDAADVTVHHLGALLPFCHDFSSALTRLLRSVATAGEKVNLPPFPCGFRSLRTDTING